MPDLRKEFGEELEKLKAERDSLRGRLNSLTGKFAEFQLFTEFRSRKRFSLSAYFDGVKDSTKLNVTEVGMRHKFQRSDGKEMEIDVLAESRTAAGQFSPKSKRQRRGSDSGLSGIFTKRPAHIQSVFRTEKFCPHFSPWGDSQGVPPNSAGKMRSAPQSGLRFFSLKNN